jgi:tRNA (mo5U34)-methyltransferase
MTHDSATLEARIRSLGEWFHNLHFGEVQTAPNHPLGDFPGQKWRRIAHALPADLTGRTVLDIGCNAGFYSLEMKRRGAAHVVAIDSDARYLAQARFAAEISELSIDFRRMSVYEVARLGERFDVVLFMGVLYHLRHPLLALDLIHDHAARDLLVFQSLLRGSEEALHLEHDYPFVERGVFERRGYPAMYFVEHRYAGDPTNWWIPNRACAEAMVRSAGFQIVDKPGDEVFICRRVAERGRDDE